MILNPSQDPTKQLERKLKAIWSLTDDEMDLFSIDQREFYRKVEDLHGITRDEAERKVREIQTSMQKAVQAA
jgi:hypothetical protein